MMSNLVVQYVNGYFKGNFKTDQNMPLVSGGEFPKDLDHYIHIYRGEISQVKDLQLEDFENQQFSIQFRAINNVQVERDASSSNIRTRIHSFSKLKFVSYSISNVHVVDGKTIGQLEGRVSGELSAREFSEEEIEQIRKEYHQDDEPIVIFEGTSDEQPDSPGGGSEPIVDEPIGENDPPLKPNPTPKPGGGGWNKPGCFSWFSNWLRWLYYLLLLILLLLFLYRCTEFGRLVKCKIELISMEKEMKSINAEQDTILQYIELTKVKVKECGQPVTQKGKNIVYQEFYDLGKKNGLVEINYDVYTIPDRIEVIYNGEIVAQTSTTTFKAWDRYDFLNLVNYGYGQFTGTLSFDYKYDAKKPTYVMIRVIPHQEIQTTEWTFTVNCPK